jgi:hypothetical protein
MTFADVRRCLFYGYSTSARSVAQAFDFMALPREARESKVFNSLRGNLGNSAGTDSQSVSTAIPKQSPTEAQLSANLTINVAENANCVITIKIILLPSNGCGRSSAAKWKAFSSSAVPASSDYSEVPATLPCARH